LVLHRLPTRYVLLSTDMAELMDRHQNEQHQHSFSNCSYWVPGTLSSSTKRLHLVISISGPRTNYLQRSQLRNVGKRELNDGDNEFGN
jgi:hypothetical protein